MSETTATATETDAVPEADYRALYAKAWEQLVRREAQILWSTYMSYTSEKAEQVARDKFVAMGLPAPD